MLLNLVQLFEVRSRKEISGQFRTKCVKHIITFFRPLYFFKCLRRLVNGSVRNVLKIIVLRTKLSFVNEIYHLLDVRNYDMSTVEYWHKNTILFSQENSYENNNNIVRKTHQNRQLWGREARAAQNLE